MCLRETYLALYVSERDVAGFATCGMGRQGAGALECFVFERRSTPPPMVACVGARAGVTDLAFEG